MNKKSDQRCKRSNLHFNKLLTSLMSTIILLMISTMSVSAANPTVKGTVVDEKNSTLIGVSVIVEGSKIAAVTDIDGNFSISVPSGNSTLVFSYIGYTSQKVKLNGQSNLKIILLEDQKKLDEVVVIGYGSQRKKDVTSAISSVDVSNISSRPMVSGVEAITGKSSGVQVSSPSGAPGADMSIRIRGVGSPNGGEPLYVVDGVIANDIKAIDPNSIESINILKDASAAGIYGAAGSTNGVVIITTKRGKMGSAKTEVSFYTGMQQIIKKLPMLSNTQWLALEKEITGTDLVIPGYYDLNATNNNWQDLTYHDAMQTGVNISTSGGSEKGNYYLGLGYLNQDGIVVGSNYKRYSVKLNVEQRATDWLKLGANLNYNRTNQRSITDNASGNFGGVVLSALTTPQYIPIHMPVGSLNPGVYGTSNFYSGENPMSDIYASTNKTIGNNLLGSTYAEFLLPFGLKYKSQFNTIVQNSKYDWFLDPYSSLTGMSQGGQGSESSSEVFRWAWDNTLSYAKVFGLHSIDVVVGTSALNEKITTSSLAGKGWATNAVQTLNGASSSLALSTGIYQWSTNSYFGRVSYSYNDRYLLTGTMRRDGSSRVGKDVVWGNFPAGSIGWKVSNEEFMKDVKWMQDLKIRGGWGKTGNLPPYTMLYPSYSLLNSGGSYAYSGGSASPGINPGGQFGNPGLKWESALQTNIGLDVSFLKHNLTLSVDYYHKKVSDMIFTQQLPLTSGGAFTALNLPGYDVNKGIEFSIDANLIKEKNFDWKINLNLSTNSNEITGIDPTISFQTGPVAIGGSKAPLYTQIIKNGYPLGTFWGYESKGVDPATGNLVYGSQLTNLGSALPKYTFGLSNEFRYKEISLSFLIDGVQGNKVYNATRMETEALSGYTNESAAVLGRWQKPGDITDIPRALGNATTNTAAAALLQNRVSSHYIEDGSFIRLKNVTLSYQFKSDLIKKIGFAGVKVYATAQNLLTITNYKGYYPEVNGSGQGTNNQATNAGSSSSLMSLGIDKGTYPAAKTFTAGVNIQF
jgi:TonB-dependent starch-binding outer membrane protein SusC